MFSKKKVPRIKLFYLYLQVVETFIANIKHIIKYKYLIL